MEEIEIRSKIKNSECDAILRMYIINIVQYVYMVYNGNVAE